jgi:hypothetical protein
MAQAQFTIPGGNEKGKTLAEASDSALKFWLGKKLENLNSGENPQYAERDKKFVEAVRAEQARRGKGGSAPRAATAPPASRPQSAPQQGSTAIERASVNELAGTFRDPKVINARLAAAAEQFNVVTPATAVGALPEGCGIALSVVQIDIEHESNPVGGGKNALAKVALDKIAGALGVSWIPDSCYRADDGSDPHYCHFKVAGYYRAFDGQPQIIIGEKQLDLREGSPMLAKLAHEAKDGVGENQIRMMRAFILEHAESKAKNRAIRSLGVRSSYPRAQLEKPFVCARIMFTGQTDDPQLKQQFATMTAEAFLGGTRTLYGAGQRDQAPARTAPAPIERVLAAPPPRGSLPADGDDFGDGDGDYDYDATGETAAANGEPAREFVIPGGPAKGTKLADATDKDIQYWAAAIGSDLENDRSRDPENDGPLHGALLDEIKRRETAKSGGQAEMKV